MRLWGFIALLLFYSGWAVAQITLDESPRQVVDARDVRFTPAGKAVFLISTGDARSTVEAAHAGQTNAVAGELLLVDRQGRFWLREEDGRSVAGFDGKTWTVRRTSDLPAAPYRTPADVRFEPAAATDSAGNVWFVDGHRKQGYWLHRLKPDGQWETKPLHGRVLEAFTKKAPKPATKPATQAATIPATLPTTQPMALGLEFAQPILQVGADGLFYASWNSACTDGGIGASGFVQFSGQSWTEYYYPVGSKQEDSLQRIFPLSDGSVGFVRLIDEPRAVWMSSAMSQPAPDLTAHIDRLGSVSAAERETAMAELIAMGPRIRAAMQSLAKVNDDPEIAWRVPTILQEISKPPPKGVFGGKYTFRRWRFLHQARSGRVYLAVDDCQNKITGQRLGEALITISPAGLWSAEPSPTSAMNKPIGALELAETPAGQRWHRIAGEGAFLLDPLSGKTVRSPGTREDAQARIAGVDQDGRLYLVDKIGVVVLR